MSDHLLTVLPSYGIPEIDIICVRWTCVVGKWDHQIVVAASTALQGLSTFVVAIPIRMCG